MLNSSIDFFSSLPGFIVLGCIYMLVAGHVFAMEQTAKSIANNDPGHRYDLLLALFWLPLLPFRLGERFARR